MLDSTGRTTYHRIQCALCPRSVGVTEYRPEFGHDGQPMNAGSWLQETKGRHELMLGRLFTLERVNDESGTRVYRFKPYTPYPAASPYALGDYAIPPFGLAAGKVLWICDSCVKLVGDDPETLQHTCNLKCRQWELFLLSYRRLTQEESANFAPSR